MKDSIVDIRNLCKVYHTLNDEVYALLDVSFSIFDKEFVSIIGPSGCGKSTILSILSSVTLKSSGDVLLGKESLKFGYMLQSDCLLPWRNVFENACLGLELLDNLTDENKDYVNYLLDKYGLKDFKYSYPDSLSGGLRQRVALIRTLAVKPDVLLLDEPFSALDYQTRLFLSNDLYNIIKNEGKTAIMVTHDISEAVSLSDRVIIISKRPGKVKNIIDINLMNKKSPIENRKDDKFMYYYNLLYKELDSHV